VSLKIYICSSKTHQQKKNTANLITAPLLSFPRTREPRRPLILILLVALKTLKKYEAKQITFVKTKLKIHKPARFARSRERQ